MAIEIYSIKLDSGEIVKVGDEICYIHDFQLDVGTIESFIWDSIVCRYKFFMQQSFKGYEVSEIVGLKSTIKNIVQ